MHSGSCDNSNHKCEEYPSIDILEKSQLEDIESDILVKDRIGRSEWGSMDEHLIAHPV